MANTLFKPKAYPARHPTEIGKVHGAILNPPRMSEIGGMDKTHKGHKAEYHNNKILRKPGGTV
jgi:hypothetical protein